MAIRKAKDFKDFKLIHSQQRLFSYSANELNGIINEAIELNSSFKSKRNFAWFNAVCIRDVDNEGNLGLRAEVYCPTIGSSDTPDVSGSLLAPCPTFCTNDSSD